MDFPRDRIDSLLESLEAREHYSLPFDVDISDPSVTPVSIAHSLNEAIDAANEAAEVRERRDPTWCTAADLVGGRFVAEISKGTMADAEVRAWLEDLAREVEARGLPVSVDVHIDDDRIPDLLDWLQLPAAPSAFLYFVDPSRSRTGRRVPPEAIRRTADPLVRWSRIPGGTLVVEKGLAEQVFATSAAAEALVEGLTDEPSQFGLRQSSLDPPRLRMARFSYDARGTLQVMGPEEPATLLDGLVDGMRILASALDYANVRRAQVTGPSDYDTELVLGRPLTAMEEVVAWGNAAHLLGDYVPDAYVAQVLTDSHLRKASDLSAFDIEPVGGGRHLVIARDVEPWIASLHPDAGVLTEARAAFGAMLLTAEVVSSNPPSWLS